MKDRNLMPLVDIFTLTTNNAAIILPGTQKNAVPRATVTWQYAKRGGGELTRPANLISNKPRTAIFDLYFSEKKVRGVFEKIWY